jgi:hypothetical protein
VSDTGRRTSDGIRWGAPPWHVLRRSVCLAAVALGLVAAMPASANFSTSHYTYKTDCSTAQDPINYVFWGPSAWWSNAAAHVQHHTDWTNTSGGRQTNYAHGICYYMGTQRASGSLSRYHVRFFWAHDDGAGRYFTAADPHHEDFVWYCGHAVDSNGSNGSGFDQGRRRLNYLMGFGHSTTTNYWGNTRNFKQCDGDWAGSNGYVGWAWI